MTGLRSPATVPGLVVPDDVDVRLLDLDHLPACADHLSPAERDRAARFHHDDDRRRFTATRHALRDLLGERLGMAPAAVSFVEQGRGKPVLAGEAAGRGVRFSVAHAGRHVVLAVADRPVGVDVEWIRSDAWDLQMAALVLSGPELAWVCEHADPDLAFFRCWTRKEAFVKVGSAGLVDELRTLTLTPEVRPTGGITVGITVVDAVPVDGVVVACALGSGTDEAGAHR